MNIELLFDKLMIIILACLFCWYLTIDIKYKKKVLGYFIEINQSIPKKESKLVTSATVPNIASEGFFYKTPVFESERRARIMLGKLMYRQSTTDDHSVSVGFLLDLVKAPTRVDDYVYGWYDLTHATIRLTDKTLYIIDLPPLVPLGKPRNEDK